MNDQIESSNISQLFAALAKAQSEFRPITRSRTVTVRPRESQPYTFDYAPLEEVLSCCLPALNSNGLALFHTMNRNDDGWDVDTILAHESGASIRQSAFVPADQWQKVGSAVTYARRYAVQCILGVAAEWDDDGNAADGNDIQVAQKRQPKTQPRPPAPVRTVPQKDPPKPAPVAAVAAEKTATVGQLEPETPPPEDGLPPDDLDQAEPAADHMPRLEDDSVPDHAPLQKGAATVVMLGVLLQRAGFDTKEAKEGYISTLCGPGHGSNYGTARRVIRQLWQEGYRAV